MPAGGSLSLIMETESVTSILDFKLSISELMHIKHTVAVH